MADDKKITFEQKLNSTSFEDDPIKYVQSAYEVADDYIEELLPDVVKNRAFYNGHDPDLVVRKNDPEVTRSAEYVPEIRPAIETRESAILDKGQEDSILVRLKLKDEFSGDEQLVDLGAAKEEELNEQMRKSGFFFDIMMTWVHAAELQPLSVVKITREEIFDWVPKKKDNSLVRDIENFLRAILRADAPRVAKTTYDWELVEERPGVEWRDFDQFLFDKTMTTLDDCRYLIDRMYLTWNEIVDAGKANDWDEEAIGAMKSEADGGGDDGGDIRARVPEQVDEAIEYNGTKKMKSGKFLVTETWVKTKNDEGEEIYQVVTLGNNKHKFKQEPGPRGLGHPFVKRVTWVKLGSLEGQSTIERLKPLQILYNDANNAILDAASYGLLPPFWVETSVTFHNKPKWYPLAFNRVDNVEGIKQVEVNVGDINVLLLVVEFYASKIKQLANAPDVSQGIGDIDKEEKATKTRLRAAGSQRRLRPLFEGVKENIIEVAMKFIKINIIDDPDWIEILEKFELDVPAYSGVSTPEEERFNALTIYEAAEKSPLYASPIGLLKLKNLFEDYLNKSRVDDIDSRLITEDELQTVIQAQVLTQGVEDESTSRTT